MPLPPLFHEKYPPSPLTLDPNAAAGGASVAAALKVAATAPAGSVLLTMLPDTAERYVSTQLFEVACMICGNMLI